MRTRTPVTSAFNPTSLVLAMALLLAASVARAQAVPPQPPTADVPQAPRILYDVSPRAVDYQLARLSPDVLALVERNDRDAKYRPVYRALLTRKGVGRGYFDEALAALQTLDRASRTTVILGALPAVAADDEETAGKLMTALLSQPAQALASERTALEAASANSSSALLRRAGFGGLLASGAPVPATWSAASDGGHLVDLLRSLPTLPPGAPAAAPLIPLVAGQAAQASDAATRAAALTALASLRPDGATFTVLAQALAQGSDPAVQRAAIAGLQRIPAPARPAAGAQDVVTSVIALLKPLPPEKRTTPDALDATQLGTALAADLPGDSGRTLRRDLRALGVQVVRLAAIPEQMRFDRRWFVVEAGKPVQIVFVNPDSMQHNVVIGEPGSLQTIGEAAAGMAAPATPSVKAYVPAIPQVIKGTGLVNWGETGRLDFIAPKAPGDYVYLCTFPGHWVRMYGVMLVVPDLEAWERDRKEPMDPITGKGFTEKE